MSDLGDIIRMLALITDQREDWTMTAILCARDGTCLQLHDTDKDVDRGLAGLGEEMAKAAQMYRENGRGKIV